ncbi:MAG: hypothetical protein JNL49_14460 [Bacteroidia bacterium]|nr:hypothetical protein [Bacteroidia bacterium]
MDYSYFNQPTKGQSILASILIPVNKVLSALNSNVKLVPQGINGDEMITIEQRINLYHLLNGVLINNVEGDVVELGCHVGNSAMQIQSIIEVANSFKKFHVYDRFNLIDNPYADIRQKFIANFEKENLKVPQIHEGMFSDTIPGQLPEKIAFAHIDAGHGAPIDEYRDVMLFLLDSIYSRMTPNSVCLLMDYHDHSRTKGGTDSNPGVKAACDIFFDRKPEKVHVLYGNRYSHGYFRKK